MQNLNPAAIGQHCLLDLHGIKPDLACDIQQIEQLLLHAAKIANATVLQAHFHSFGRGQGVTGVLLLSESHISIHTWPEHQLATIDIFMCGEHRIDDAIAYLKQVFTAKRIKISKYHRGLTGDLTE